MLSKILVLKASNSLYYLMVINLSLSYNFHLMASYLFNNNYHSLPFIIIIYIIYYYSFNTLDYFKGYNYSLRAQRDFNFSQQL